MHFSAHDGWEKNALWRVDFPEGERFHEVSSDSAVVVALNADLTALHSLIELSAGPSPTRVAKAIITKMLFGEILSTIIHTVLEDYRRFHEEEGLTVDDLEEDRLTVRVLRFLDDHGVSEADARSNRLSDLAAVAHFVQGSIDTGREFDLAAWERLTTEGYRLAAGAGARLLYAVARDATSEHLPGSASRSTPSALNIDVSPRQVTSY